jgi:hypothetical protein
MAGVYLCISSLSQTWKNGVHKVTTCHRRRSPLTLGTHTSTLKTITTDLLAITMVSKMMLHSIAQFLVFFAAATGAEARSGSFQPARSLQRHFEHPDPRGMPATRK